MRATGDRLILVATACSVVAAAGFTAVASYNHFYDLARAHGQNSTGAALLPLSVDLLILAASLVLLWAARNKIPAPWPIRAVLFAFVAVTIAGNAAYAAPDGAESAALSSLPGITFVASIELLMWMVRARKAVSPASPASPPQVSLPADNVELAQRAYADTVKALNPFTQNQLQQKYGLTRAQASRVRKGPESAALTADPPQAVPRPPSPSGPLVPVNGNGRVHA